MDAKAGKLQGYGRKAVDVLTKGKGSSKKTGTAKKVSGPKVKK